MVYRIDIISEKTKIAYWKLEESSYELFSMFPINRREEILNSITNMHSQKRAREYMAARLLLAHISNDQVEIAYHADRKPFLKGLDCFVSISHNNNFVALILDDESEVGIDIEEATPKLRRTKKKYLNEREMIDLDNELAHLALHWSAKETVFKVKPNNKIVFKTDLFVHPFAPKKEGTFTLDKHFENESRRFIIHYNNISDDNFVTWARLKDGSHIK